MIDDLNLQNQFMQTTPISKNKFIFDMLVKEWSNADYCEIAVLVAWLRALTQIHQSNHWMASGDPFYGDHLLFQKLYELPDNEIDKFAEKAVGLGSPYLVDIRKQSRQTHSIISLLTKSRPGIPGNNDLANSSYEFELSYKDAVEFSLISMERNKTITSGISNLLEQSVDDHEGSIYLLKQRLVQF